LQFGEAVTIGYTILMVQRRRAPAPARRLHSHGTFEESLEDACERAGRTGAGLAVVRVRVEDDDPPGRAGDRLADLMRAGDFLAQYAPGDYEVLLIDTEPARARAIAEELARHLRSDGLGACGVAAVYPGDGRTADALIGRASALLRGDRGEDAKGARGPVLKSQTMIKLYRMAERAANGQSANGLINVLILGETGVGKEVLADYIHRASARANGPCVCINCAALSGSLLESELFGYEKGAFTDAKQAKAGLLEAASGGTVFLDEIGEMPIALQTTLLRAMENREITRVGGLKPRPIDVRFVAATNRDLEGEVARQGFRRDLYFRLNGISLTIPPLRERPEEIEALANQFLADATGAGGKGRRPPRISEEAFELLRAYCWPGNIRELRNVIERALLLCDTAEITAEHLPIEKMRLARLAPQAPAVGVTPASEVTAPMPMLPLATPGPGPHGTDAHTPWTPPVPAGMVLSPKDLAERRDLLALMAECAGSQTAAAERLGISRGTLIARLKRLGIPRPRVGRPD
jgi:DNA-binding NtrC family response regulator